MNPLGKLDQIHKDVAAAGVSGLWTTLEDVDMIGNDMGAYILMLQIGETVPIERPRMAACQLVPGRYLYMGSAWGSGGIRARVKRHFLPDKRPHWHIDQLTVRSAGMAALVVPGADECELAGKLLGSGRFKIAAIGFGSTDCRNCQSHLLTTCES